MKNKSDMTNSNNITLPQRDPVGAYMRNSIAARRIAGQQCACGESRPEALIPGTDPVSCYECDRKRKGHTTLDEHHSAMEANNPLLLPIPANDHRAELNVAQYDWPKQTRENPNGCPLLAAAGCIRGLVDWLIYVIKKSVLWIPAMLETLSRFLAETVGIKWFVGTPIEQFAPERKPA